MLARLPVMFFVAIAFFGVFVHASSPGMLTAARGRAQQNRRMGVRTTKPAVGRPTDGHSARPCENPSGRCLGKIDTEQGKKGQKGVGSEPMLPAPIRAKRSVPKRRIGAFVERARLGDLEHIKARFVQGGIAEADIARALLYGTKDLFLFLLHHVDRQALELAARIGASTRRGRKCARAVQAWQRVLDTFRGSSMRNFTLEGYDSHVKLFGGIDLNGRRYAADPYLPVSALLDGVARLSYDMAIYFVEYLSPSMRGGLLRRMCEVEGKGQHRLLGMLCRVLNGESMKDITGFSFAGLDSFQLSDPTVPVAAPRAVISDEKFVEMLKSLKARFDADADHVLDTDAPVVRHLCAMSIQELPVFLCRISSALQSITVRLLKSCRPLYKFELLQAVSGTEQRVERLLTFSTMSCLLSEWECAIMSTKLAAPFIRQSRAGDLAYVQEHYNDPRITSVAYAQAMLTATGEVAAFLFEKALPPALTAYQRYVSTCHQPCKTAAPGPHCEAATVDGTLRIVAELWSAMEVSWCGSNYFGRRSAPKMALGRQPGLESVIKIFGERHGGRAYPMQPAVTDGVVTATIVLAPKGRLMDWFLAHVDEELLRDAAVIISSMNPDDARLLGLRAAYSKVYMRALREGLHTVSLPGLLGLIGEYADIFVQERPKACCDEALEPPEET